MSSLGQRIRRLRQEREYSLRSLAKRAEMSVAYLSKLERDESSPTVALLRRLAEALDVPLEDLVALPEAGERELELPDSLKEFIYAYKDSNEELKDPAWQRALSEVRLRGTYPETKEDWAPIFLSMRRAFRGD